MKVRTKRQIAEANKVFTDRKEPRKAFWDRYKLFEEQMQEDGDISVLSYYGIGGIGKTTLLKKLIEELKENNPKAQYIYYDFGLSQNTRSVLQSMKHMMEKENKFYFPLFDLALFVYANKIGDKTDSPEVKSFVDHSPFLNAIVTAAGAIPLFGLASQLILAADRGLAFVRTFVNNHKKELAEIEYKEAVEIYKSLPIYFAMDLADNLEDCRHPFVFFLDTYEQLVNEMASIGEPLMNDEWIRGADGLIQNTPNAMWVIAGREKLKWERFDADWADALDQHILGGLSEADAVSFLDTAGVGPSLLREQIYSLTKGIPIYLDICVERYSSLVADGKCPEISDFGNNEHALIERFVRYMDDAKKDIVYVLSCLNIWTDEMIQAIGGRIVASFSLTSYEKVKEFSFIHLDDEGNYSIHKIVGETLVNTCPEVIKTATVNEAVKFCTQIIETTDLFDTKCFYYLNWLSNFGVENFDDKRFLEQFREIIYGKVKKLLNRGRYKEVELIYNPILSRADGNTTTELYAAASCGYARVLLGMSRIKDAIHYGKIAVDRYNELCDEKDERYLRAALIYSRCLYMDGQNEEALKIAEYVMNKRLEIYGYENEDTLTAMSAYANCLSIIGQYKDALELREKIYKYRQQILGPEHYSTIETMNNIAREFISLGRSDEALEWKKNVVELYKKVLGDKHISTFRAITGLGNCYLLIGNYNKALEIYEANYTNMVNVFGEYNVYVLRALGNYGIGLARLGRYEENLKIMEEVLSKCREILGENHPDTVVALSNYGNGLARLGRYEESLKIRVEVLSKRREILGENHLKAVDAMNSIAWMCFLTGKSKDGVQYIEECIEKCQHMELSEVSRINYMDTLALIYADIGRSDDAVRLSLENLNTDKQLYPDNKERISSRFFACAYAYNSNGNKEKALEYAIKSKELREECGIKGDTYELLEKMLSQLQV